MMTSLSLSVFRATALALLLGGASLGAQDYGNNKPPPVPKEAVPLTAEQRAALEAIDVRIAGLEALLPKIDDAKFKAGVVTAVADFKRRRAAQARNFDQATYDALMHQVIGRFQVTSLWLRAPRVPEPATR